MADAVELKRSIKICMFNRYGTVADMQGVLPAHATATWRRLPAQGPAA